ncbi:MAG: Cof-type HAD-IIB family hydrolase [Formosimonas sp.]
MSSKIFFFDIDNTLLDHQTNQIPDSALQAVADLKAAGHTVAIATGRGYGHALEFIEQIDPAYAIMHNGAQVLKGREFALKIPLPEFGLTDLFEWIQAQGYYYGISDGLSGHVSAQVPEVTEPMDSVEIAFQSDLEFYRTSEIYQAWLFFPEHLDDEFVPLMRARFPQFDFVRWHDTAMDILTAGVNKMTGCDWVLNDAQIHVRNSYAFGDGLNDIEMLQGVGTGIAMGNAHPRLKSVAHRVAEPIHQDGLAKMVAQLQTEFAQ